MEHLFLTFVNMSLTASYVILIVLVARMFLNKAPKIFSYGLWSIVLFRLLCPFSFSSVISFLGLLKVKTTQPIPANIGYMAKPEVDLGSDVVNNVLNSSLPAATPTASVNPMQIIINVLTVIWLIGFTGLLLYSLISYLGLKRKVSTAMLVNGNVYESEKITSPFVLGIIKPKIYLPVFLNENERSYIILHEQIHIRRFDYLVKLLAFFAVCLHWFNPLVWLSFKLMTGDMEMACDEQVLKELGTEIKKDYSTSLLALAVGRRRLVGGPLAFGESSAHRRIKNVLNYKRPTFWAALAAFVVVVILGVGLLANPSVSSDEEEKMHIAQVWAEALKLRDGKLRYELMSENMKERFIAQQKGQQGEDWNFTIGGSSPWVVDYEITIQGEQATILYHLTDSSGEKYERTEILTFGWENKQLVVIDAKEKIAEWDRVYYFAPDAWRAMEVYTQALLDSDYLTLLSLTHGQPFDPDGQEIWDTIKITNVKVVSSDIRENKACFELELEITDGGNSAFEPGVFPRWLWLVKGEQGWYVEGLMTGGAPDETWWNEESKSSNEVVISDLKEKDIITAERFNETDYPLLAKIPGEDIYLYGLKPAGVVLKYGDKFQAFNWDYITPRFILPVLKKADLDKDGVDEISCVLNVGSGTGVYLDELHILKPKGQDGYADYLFSDYLDQVNELVSFTYDQNKNSILIKTGNKSLNYVIPEEYAEYSFEKLGFGDIIHFTTEDGLKINLPPALIFKEIASPQFMEDIEFQGDIVFENGEFKIINLQIVKIQ